MTAARQVRDQRLAVLGSDGDTFDQVVLLRRLSDDVTLFLHEAPEPAEEQWEQLARLGVRVVAPPVERLVVDGAQVRAVEVEGGHTFEIDAVVVAPRLVARTEVHEGTAGEQPTTSRGERVGHLRGRTPVRGMWVAATAGELAAVASDGADRAAVDRDGTATDLDATVRARPFSAATEARVTEWVLGDRRHGL